MPTAAPSDERLAADLRATIRDYPDWPRPGVLFRDLMPVFADVALMRRTVRALAEPHAATRPTHVVAIESRGFILGAPVALELGLPLVPVRKLGKLPGPTAAVSYALEYGQDTLEVQRGSLGRGSRCLVVDDVLATGGTATAVSRLLASVGAGVAGYAFVVALRFLPGLDSLAGSAPVTTLVEY
jgi:adenine phosphoribosyltransferase